MGAAGELRYRVHCQRRADVVDGYGNTNGEWQTEFTVAAAYRHLRGGEDVMAARLSGRHPAIITVRASSQSEQVTTDWRLVDARDGTEWAISDVTAETDGQYIALLCVSGVAT